MLVLAFSSASHMLPRLKVIGFYRTYSHTEMTPSLLFLHPLVQDNTADEKVESSADGDGDEDRSREEPIKPESDKMEEGCGRFTLEVAKNTKTLSSNIQLTAVI